MAKEYIEVFSDGQSAILNDFKELKIVFETKSCPKRSSKITGLYLIAKTFFSLIILIFKGQST